MGNKGILILGAGSSIAKYTAQAFAKKGHPLYLAGRDLEELKRTASDLHIRFNVDVKTGYFDALKIDEHELFLQQAVKELGGIEGVLVAFGEYPKGKKDFLEENLIFQTNFIGACSILHHCANYFAVQESGFIIGISSVAGDRGKRSNYPYCAAKSGLNTYLQGLRQRLASHGIRVVTIKPGYVDTPMSFGLPRVFLNSSPQEVGEKIARSVERGQEIVYLPWFWRYIIGAINLIPEKIYKRLKFL